MKRDLLLDYLKFVAILVVVMIHLPGTGMLCSVFPFNVNATFAILAGMFTFSSSSFVEWLKKRWHRLVLPYLLWEMIYFIANVVFDIVTNRCHSFGWHDICMFVFWGGASVQLWFVITLFYAQILLWLFASVMKMCGVRSWIALVLLALGGIWLYGSVDEENIRRTVFMVGYCSLGALLRYPYDKFVGTRFLSAGGGAMC